MMNKIKILLGEQNAQTMCIGLIKYSILFLLLKFLQPWIVCTIWVVGATIGSFFLTYAKEKKENGAKVDIGLLLATTAWFCLPLSVLQAVVYCFTFRYIDWVGIPAFTVANMILWMFVFDRCDDEPRTKTTPSDKEATNDENNHVVSEAQDIPAGCDRPDINGDPEIEPEIQFTREEWEEAKKTLGDVDAVVDKLIKKLEEAGYDAWKSVKCGHPVKKYFSCTVQNTGEPVEGKEANK